MTEPQDLTLPVDLVIQTRIEAYDRAAEMLDEASLDDILTTAQKIEAFLLTGEVAVD